MGDIAELLLAVKALTDEMRSTRQVIERAYELEKARRVSPVRKQTDGFMSLHHVLAVIPISKSGWWAGVKSGKYPRAVKISPRRTAWRIEDIQALIEQMGKK